MALGIDYHDVWNIYIKVIFIGSLFYNKFYNILY